MRLCSCGEQNPDDRRYCFCGASLIPDAQPPATTPAAPAEAPDRATTQVLAHAVSAQGSVESPTISVRQTVVLLLRLGDGERHLNPDEPPPRLTVAAGGRVSLRALVRNQGTNVDNYDLRIEGADPAWWTVAPGTVDLIPFGTHDGYEQEVEVQLHPPRSPLAEARDWELTLVVRSRWTSADVATVRILMEIEPYAQLGVRVRPQIASGRREAPFISRVHNAGNAPVIVAQAGVDPGDLCLVKFAAPELELLPGRVVDVPLTVRARRPIWIGRPLDHRFEVSAAAAEPEEVQQTAPGIFRQRPWLPWWLAIVLPLLVIAIIALIALLGGDGAKAARLVTVPNLANAPNRLTAEQRLQKRELTLSSEPATRKHKSLQKWAISPKAKKLRHVQRRHAGKLVPAFAIIAQSPPPGAKVPPGTEVAIQVQRPRRMIVPRLTGMTAANAEKRLMERNLSLGNVTPEPDPTFRVVSQIPKPETLRRRGTAVDIHLALPKKKKKKKTTTTNASKNAAARAGDGKAKKVKVPAIESVRLSVYARSLRKGGLRRHTVRKISTRPRGAVLATTPKAGTRVKRGTNVRVVVSAGFPRLAYNNARNVMVVGGAAGTSPKAFAIGPPARTEPTWTPAAERVAYRAGDALFFAQVGRRAAPRLITPVASSASFANPAFSPSRQRNVLAFVRRGELDALCLSAVGRRRARTPHCQAVPGWTLGRISWAPDGMTMLVAAARRDHPERFGLLRFSSKKPFSVRADLWIPEPGLVTPWSDGHGVRAASISPDGRRLAAISNLGGASFRLAITTIGDLELEHADLLRVVACDVVWRPDGAEVAVVQAGPTCAGELGSIGRLVPEDPARVATLVVQGEHPVWEPMNLEAD